MFFSGVQLFSSALGWVATNALGCAQVNIKEPEVTSIKGDSDDPSIVTFDESEPVQIFQKSIACFIKLLGNEVIWKTYKASLVLAGSTSYECYKFALNFFALQLLKDSTLIEKEEKWPQVYSKIENIVKKTFEDVVKCREDIGLGYCIIAGMPFSLATKDGGSPIPFANISDNVSFTDEKYVDLLYSVVPHRMINYAYMKALNTAIMKKILVNGTFYQLPDRAEEFIFTNVKRSISEISVA